MPRFQVQRSIEIDAAKKTVFDTVSDYGQWTQWSPWLCAEPDARVTVSDDPSSVGSVYAWDGAVVGKGEIEHMALNRPESITEELRIAKPFKSVSKVLFDLADSGSGTKITWTMQGSLPWFLFWMRPMMETMIGMDYERGLRMLKELIESGSVASKTQVHGVEQVASRTVVGIRRTCSMDDIGPSMQAAFEELREHIGQCEGADGAEVLSVYHQFDMKTRVVEYTAGYSLDGEQNDVPSGLSKCQLSAGGALKVAHTGSYQNLGNAWSAGYQYARYRKLKVDKRLPAFEIYRNDSTQVEPAELLTDVYIPVR